MSLHVSDAPSASLPEKTSVTAISPDELTTAEVRAVFAIWDERRANRLMPARDTILPRPLGSLLRNVSLLRVLPSEDDYEFRIVGDAHVQAYGVNYQGKRMSDVISASPGFGQVLKASYDAVCATRAPIAYRGLIGRDVGDARFMWFETIYLPLGSSTEMVDHVMNASVYLPRNGAWST